MKKLAAILCLSALTTGAFAQGLVNFFNNPTTIISATINNQTAALAANSPGAYWFGLLTSDTGAAGTYTFSGIYATNLSAAGRINGGNGVAIPGWAAGTTKFFEVAGWDAAANGTTFQNSWLTQPPANGLFGISGSGSGIAGGSTATGTIPNLNLFGGASGIQAGFTLSGSGGPIIPEPSTMALAGLGAAALLIFRRRK